MIYSNLAVFCFIHLHFGGPSAGCSFTSLIIFLYISIRMQRPLMLCLSSSLTTWSLNLTSIFHWDFCTEQNTCGTCSAHQTASTLYSIWQQHWERKTKITAPTLLRLRLLCLRMGSARTLATVQQKLDPPDEIICNMTSYAFTAYTGARREENIQESPHLECSSPIWPLPTLAVTPECPPINMDLRWSFTVYSTLTTLKHPKNVVM